MKKIVLLLIVLVLMVAQSLLAQRIGTLPALLKPESLKIHNGQVFVVQGAQILNYSLKDLTLLHTIGRDGEGPGELKETMHYHNDVTITDDYIFADGDGKIIYFDRNGKLIKEMRKPPGLFHVQPVGKSYVGMRLTEFDEDKGVQYAGIYLYNGEFKSPKKLMKHRMPTQSKTMKNDIILDVLDFCVLDNKIYIEDSRNGFVIHVFDDNGNKLQTINKDKEIEKRKITGKDWDAAIERYKNDPFVKAITWERFNQMVTFVSMKHFPAIEGLEVSGNKIFARTWLKQDDKFIWYVMDLEGKILHKALVPQFLEIEPIVARMSGVKYYTVENNKLYFIKENLDKEEWELFGVDLVK